MKNGTDAPCYEHAVPQHMIDGPHLVHFDGRLVQPGRHNDYTFHNSENEGMVLCRWWNTSVATAKIKLVSIIRMDTGDRWAFSSEEGVYIDTRLEREMLRVAKDLIENSIALDPISAGVVDREFWNLIRGGP